MLMLGLEPRTAALDGAVLALMIRDFDDGSERANEPGDPLARTCGLVRYYCVLQSGTRCGRRRPLFV